MSSVTIKHKYAPLSAVGANDNCRLLRPLDIEPGLVKDDLNVSPDVLRQSGIDMKWVDLV